MQILVSADLAAGMQSRLRQEAPDVEIIMINPTGPVEKPLEHVDIILRNYTLSGERLVAVLDQTPHLRWMQSISAGVEGVLPIFIAHAPADAMLTNGSGAMSRPIAEYCLAQMCAINKTLSYFARAQAREEWERSNLPPPRDLMDTHVLVVGLGSIGGEIARLCRAVGMHVWGVRRRPAVVGETIDGIDQILGFTDDWRSALPGMDYVIICTPLTDLTRNLISTRELAALSDTSWIINVARGAIVDETALIEALRGGKIGGAVLDVTTTEPLPPGHPLWSLPNAVITPHISWRSPGDQERMLDIFMENLRRFRSGEPLRNQVDRAIGY